MTFVFMLIPQIVAPLASAAASKHPGRPVAQQAAYCVRGPPMFWSPLVKLGETLIERWMAFEFIRKVACCATSSTEPKITRLARRESNWRRGS